MVKLVLESSEEARNSDVALTSMIWKRFYSSHIINIDNCNAILLRSLTVLPMFDTISRARRMIQNDEHLFLPTDIKVVKTRRINEEIWRKAMASKQITIFDNNKI